MGPKASGSRMNLKSTCVCSHDSNCILIIVIVKPRHVSIVKDVPFQSESVLWATKVENNGESAITTNPHITKNTSNRIEDGVVMKKGDNKQQTPDENKKNEANGFVPIFETNCPPIIQDKVPVAIIINDHNDILIFFSFVLL